MKKLLLSLMVLLLFVSAAQAEIILVDGYSAHPAEAALSERLAESLAAALQTDVSVRHEADALSAINAFLGLPEGSSPLLLCTQEAMILSLQGYTDQDLRTAVLPAARVAASESWLYASPAVLELVPSPTLDSLTAYTEENPYQLFIARLIDASPADYLTLEATRDMYVDQNLYMDDEEMGAEAKAGAPDLAVFSAAMLPGAAADYERLFPAGLPGLWQGLFARPDGEKMIPVLSQAALALNETPEGREMLSDAGYTPGSGLDAEEFTGEVKALFAEYVRYLTNEGLFFYEQ